jgi:hypothetical protein
MRRLIISMLTAALVAAVLSPSAMADPFPNDDPGFRYFSTPSARIVCEYRTAVTCTNFASGRNAAGELGQRYWAVRSTGRAVRGVVIGNFPSESPRAKYGVTYRHRGIVCRIRRLSGIRCVNRSGHGFQVSVQRQRTF